MLQNMRTWSKSWIMRGFFGILVLSFIFLWGISDVFQPGKLADHSVATVGNVKISLHDFIKETKAKSMQIQQQSGQQVDENVIQQSVLQSLIYNALLDQEADHLGLAISDQQIIDLVKSSPAFKDKNGDFSRVMFEAIARSEGMTPKDFEQDLRKQMRRNQLLQLVSTGLSMPKAYLTPLFKWQHEKRNIDWATIDPSSFKLPAPKPEEISAFYENHKDQFTKPETRDITVAILSEESIRAKIKLTDEQTQAGFATRQSDKKSSLPTKAETEKIISEIKAEKSMDEFNRLATLIEDNLSGGVTLEELAKTHDLKLVKIEGLQRDGGTSNKPAVSPDAIVEAIEQGFKMETGDDPFLSQLGNGEYMAARLDKVTPSKLISLEEVSKDITSIVTAENQDKAAKQLAASLVEKINAGTQLAQIAKDNKLVLKAGVVLDRMDQKDQAISRSLRSIAFNTELNKAAVAPSDKGTYAVVVPRKIIEPKSEEIKDEEITAFSTALERNMADDMLQQYWASLEKRFRIQLNDAALKQLQK